MAHLKFMFSCSFVDVLGQKVLIQKSVHISHLLMKDQTVYNVKPIEINFDTKFIHVMVISNRLADTNLSLCLCDFLNFPLVSALPQS